MKRDEMAHLLQSRVDAQRVSCHLCCRNMPWTKCVWHFLYLFVQVISMSHELRWNGTLNQSIFSTPLTLPPLPPPSPLSPNISLLPHFLHPPFLLTVSVGCRPLEGHHQEGCGGGTDTEASHDHVPGASMAEHMCCSASEIARQHSHSAP